MLVENEYYRTRADGVRLVKTYSDCKLAIHKKGTSEKYNYVIDIENHPYSYEETNEVVQDDDTDK